jgi:hypothetical protein
MVWKSEQRVDEKHMQVFQCETCGKLKAVLHPSDIRQADAGQHCVL